MYEVQIVLRDGCWMLREILNYLTVVFDIKENSGFATFGLSSSPRQLHSEGLEFGQLKPERVSLLLIISFGVRR